MEGRRSGASWGRAALPDGFLAAEASLGSFPSAPGPALPLTAAHDWEAGGASVPPGHLLLQVLQRSGRGWP